MKQIIDRFKITDGRSFSLKDCDTADTNGYKKEDADEALAELIKKTAIIQNELYADNSTHY